MFYLWALITVEAFCDLLDCKFHKDQILYSPILSFAADVAELATPPVPWAGPLPAPKHGTAPNAGPRHEHLPHTEPRGLPQEQQLQEEQNAPTQHLTNGPRISTAQWQLRSWLSLSGELSGGHCLFPSVCWEQRSMCELCTLFLIFFLLSSSSSSGIPGLG